MNANELANEIESLGDEIGFRFTQKIATTLRQQSQEIEELKAEKLIHDESYLIQMKEIIKLKEYIEFLEDKNMMVDTSEIKYGFQYLFGGDLLEANQKITNMIRNMVDEELEKQLKKTI